jgi:hypothetical protein
MVGIHSAGSAANVRRLRRETVLTRFRGDAQDAPLDLEDRTCASVVLDFERNEQPTPEQSESVRPLEAALAKDPQSVGQPVSLVIQNRRLGVETRVSKALWRFQC